MTTPTPTTAAGRELLTNAHWDSDGERLLLPGYVGVGDLKADILDIEAEAREQERERIRAAIVGLGGCRDPRYSGMFESRGIIWRADALAILDTEAQ